MHMCTPKSPKREEGWSWSWRKLWMKEERHPLPLGLTHTHTHSGMRIQRKIFLTIKLYAHGEREKQDNYSCILKRLQVGNSQTPLCKLFQGISLSLYSKKTAFAYVRKHMLLLYLDLFNCRSNSRLRLSCSILWSLKSRLLWSAALVECKAPNLQESHYIGLTIIFLI